MKYTEVPSETFYKHVKKQVGFDLIDKIIDSYGYLAGGSCRAWFADEKISDYDFFFEDEVSYLKLEKEIFKENLFGMLKIREEYKELYKVAFESDNAISLINLKTESKIQLIKTRFSSLEDQIKVFDFSVCSAAYNLIDKSFIMHPLFFDDLKSKRIRILPTQDGLLYPLAEVERIARYSRKGYKIRGVDIVYVLLFIAERFKKIHTYQDFKAEINGMDISLIDGVFEETDLKLDGQFDGNELYDKIQEFLETKASEREE